MSATSKLNRRFFGKGTRELPVARCVAEPLEDRLLMYNLGERWNFDGNLISYSYSNLFDGGVRQGDGAGGLGAALNNADLRWAIEESLMAWAAVANISFFERADSGPSPLNDDEYDAAGHPIMRFGHHFMDGNMGLNTLAHGRFPQDNGIGGDVHFDDGNTWNADFFLETAIHEVGHAIGIEHANGDVDDGDCPDAVPAIMDACAGTFDYNGLDTAFLLPDDVAAVRDHYGTGMGFLLDLGGVLHVPGTNDTDLITVESVPEGIRVTSLNGTFTRPLAGLTGLLVHGRGGTDHITIKSLPGNLPVTVRGDGGSDTLIVGNGDWDAFIGSNIHFIGGEGSDSVYVDDTKDDFGRDTYDIRTASFRKTHGRTLTVDVGSLESMTVQGSGHADQFNIHSTAQTGGYTLWVSGNNGDDRFTLGGGNIVNVGQPVMISGDGGYDTFQVWDPVSSGDMQYRVTDDFMFIRQPGFAERWVANYSSFEKVQLDANRRNNVIGVTGVKARELIINASGGRDTIRLGNAGEGFSSVLAGVTTTVNGQDGVDKLIADDAANGSNGVYTIFNDRIRGTNTGDIRYDFLMDEVQVIGGGLSWNSNRFEVISTSAWTPMYLDGGPGADVFNVTGAGIDRYTLLGDVHVDGRRGADRVLWDDLAAMQGTPLAVDVFENYIRHPVGWMQIHGILGHKGVEDVTVRMNNGDSPVNVHGNAVNSRILGGSGNNTFHLFPRVNGGPLRFKGKLDLEGGIGDDQIHVWDEGDYTGLNYIMAGGRLSGIGTGTVDTSFNDGLTFHASNGNDTFGNVEGTLGNPPVTAYGNGGDDWFNVEVRLTPATWNVHGGAGLNYLNVSDERNTQSPVNEWTISPTSITRARTGFPGLSRTVNYHDIYYATITGGTSTDTFKVAGTAPSMNMVVYGHLGPDTMTLDYAGLQNNRGHLIYMGYSGDDSLVIDNTADPDGARFHLSDTHVGSFAGDTLAAAGLAFYSVAEVTVNLGPAADVAIVKPNYYSKVQVNAGNPLGGEDGDVLEVALAAATNYVHTPDPGGTGSGVWTSDASAPFRYTGFEDLAYDDKGPVVVEAVFNTSTATPTIDFRFDEPLGLPLHPVNVQLTNLTTGEEIWGPTSVVWDAATNTARYSFANYAGTPMPAGTYRAKLHAYLVDAWGNPMGKDYVFEFTYTPPAA